MCIFRLFICTGTFSQENAPTEIKVVDKSPIAQGCDPKASNPELKECFTRVVQDQIVRKINTSYLQNHNLPSGIYTVHTIFSIDVKGKVQDVKANFENTKIATYLIER